jgi:hypothetical protein
LPRNLGSTSSSGRASFAFEPLEQRELLSATPEFFSRLANVGNLKVTGVASDLSADVVVVGTFGGTADFDPSGSTHNLDAINGPAFIAKYDANGKFQWARQLGASGGATPGAVVIDPFGSVLVVGVYAGAAQLSVASGSPFVHTAVGNRDIFVTKLTSAGDLRFVTIASTPDDENVVGADVDQAGNVYIAANLVQAGMSDKGYLARYNGRGKGVALRTIGDGSVGFDFTSMATALHGEILLSGTVAGAGVDLDTDPDPFVVHDIGGAATFFLRLLSDGTFVYVAALPATGLTVTAIDADTVGNIYATGSYSGTLDFNPSSRKLFALTSAGGTDAFVAKYSTTGGLAFAKGMGSSTADTGGDIAVDPVSGEIQVTGTFTGKAYFNPFVSLFRFYSLGGTDAFLSRFSNNGVFLDASQFGGTSNDDAPLVTLVGDGTVYLTGPLSGTQTIDLDPGPGVHNLSNSNAADTDGYLVGLFD